MMKKEKCSFILHEKKKSFRMIPVKDISEKTKASPMLICKLLCCPLAPDGNDRKKLGVKILEPVALLDPVWQCKNVIFSWAVVSNGYFSV